MANGTAAYAPWERGRLARLELTAPETGHENPIPRRGGAQRLWSRDSGVACFLLTKNPPEVPPGAVKKNGRARLLLSREAASSRFKRLVGSLALPPQRIP